MRLWKKVISVLFVVGLLGGCDALREQTPGYLLVREARLVAAADGPRLEVDLECRLNGPISDALEHGIPITLKLDLSAIGEQDTLSNRGLVELRYFPLTRRYQLRDIASGDLRSFPASAYLTDALASLRLPLPRAFGHLQPGARLRLEVGLDHAALPGALRLPAMLEPAWRLKAPEYVWTVTAG